MRIDIKDFKGCPKCGGEEFEKGPRGGLAFMLRCAKCGQVLTVYPFIGVEVW